MRSRSRMESEVLRRSRSLKGTKMESESQNILSDFFAYYIFPVCHKYKNDSQVFIDNSFNHNLRNRPKSTNQQRPVVYAEICEGGFCAENTIALNGPGKGQNLPKLGRHSKIKCFGFKNILQ